MSDANAQHWSIGARAGIFHYLLTGDTNIHYYPQTRTEGQLGYYSQLIEWKPQYYKYVEPHIAATAGDLGQFIRGFVLRDSAQLFDSIRCGVRKEPGVVVMWAWNTKDFIHEPLGLMERLNLLVNILPYDVFTDGIPGKSFRLKLAYKPGVSPIPIDLHAYCTLLVDVLFEYVIGSTKGTIAISWTSKRRKFDRKFKRYSNKHLKALKNIIG